MSKTVGKLQPTDRFEWERVLRRVRVDPTTKLVGLIAATYADRDGSSVRPGETRLAAVSGTSPRTVRRCLAKLRSLGLLELVSRSGRRAARADVHRLTVPENLLVIVELLPVSETPDQGPPVAGDENPAACGQLTDQGPPMTGDDDEQRHDHRPPEAPDEPITGHMAHVSPATGDRPPEQRPSTSTSPDQHRLQGDLTSSPEPVDNSAARSP